LKSEIEKGAFREDLYYRLNVVNIHVPPLRERKDDIPLLAGAFLREFAEENGKTIEGFDNKVRAAFFAYEWPGNVRELRNCVESAVVMARGNTITSADLPPGVRDAQEDRTIRVPPGSSLAEAEKILIRETLAAQGGNKSRTAEILESAGRPCTRNYRNTESRAGRPKDDLGLFESQLKGGKGLGGLGRDVLVGIRLGGLQGRKKHGLPRASSGLQDRLLQVLVGP
jgi:DNA-binding NtrC family response regulator